MDPELKAELTEIGTRLDRVQATAERAEQSAARAEQSAARAERGVDRCAEAVKDLAGVVARIGDEGRRNAQLVGNLAEAVGTMSRHLHGSMADVVSVLERTERSMGEYGDRLTRIMQIVMEGRTSDSERITAIEHRLAHLEAKLDPA